jgi:hypothetical protein
MSFSLSPLFSMQFGYTVYRRVLAYYANSEDAFGESALLLRRRKRPRDGPAFTASPTLLRSCRHAKSDATGHAEEVSYTSGAASAPRRARIRLNSAPHERAARGYILIASCHPNKNLVNFAFSRRNHTHPGSHRAERSDVGKTCGHARRWRALPRPRHSFIAPSENHGTHRHGALLPSASWLPLRAMGPRPPPRNTSPGPKPQVRP